MLHLILFQKNIPHNDAFITCLKLCCHHDKMSFFFILKYNTEKTTAICSVKTGFLMLLKYCAISLSLLNGLTIAALAQPIA